MAVTAYSLLLANHGPVVAGKSLDAAGNSIEELEDTARLYLLLRDLPTRFLSENTVSTAATNVPE